MQRYARSSVAVEDNRCCENDVLKSNQRLITERSGVAVMKRIQFVRITSASLISVILAGCASSTALFREPSVLVKDPGSLIGRPKV